MKKFLFIIFIFFPILGFIRGNFFPNQSIYLNYSKGSSFFQVLAYRGEGLSSNFKMDACIVYKLSNMKVPLMVSLTQEGFIEKKQIDSSFSFKDAYLLLDYRGHDADKSIQKLDNILKRYPFVSETASFLGPNSNTVVAYVMRKMELPVQLLSNCSGKDYLGSGIRWSYQTNKRECIGSISGFIAILVSKEQFQLQLMGLTLGYDWEREKLYLPGFGDLEIGDLILKFKSKI
jgi:hypothetical protein